MRRSMKKVKQKVKLFNDKKNKANHAKKAARKRIAKARTASIR